jgi:stearoyl-CoA desaturase (delta-9 desaturase)
VSTPKKRRSLLQSFDFLGIVAIHLGSLYAFYRGVHLKWVLIAIGSYYARMFLITGAYHRYFSHRTYKTSRAFQFLLAFFGTFATQKGPLWWGSTHRRHHKYSDLEEDVHSPLRRGFWYSHMGWWLGTDHEKTDWDTIRDFTSYPELMWLEKWHVVGPFAMMGLCALIGGFDCFLWGYVVPTMFLMHGTFTINSLSHVYGSRRYATTDTSRNNFLLALITLGEGWHNNHHHYQSSANQGFYWWEIDVSYYILKTLEFVGLVWDVRSAPEHVKRRNLISEVGEKSPLLLAKQGKAAPPSAGDDDGPKSDPPLGASPQAS